MRVFGNLSDDDIATTVPAMPTFLAPGGTVIWTRHRGEPDMATTIDGWFADSGFARLSSPAPSIRTASACTDSSDAAAAFPGRAPVHIRALTPVRSARAAMRQDKLNRLWDTA